MVKYDRSHYSSSGGSTGASASFDSQRHSGQQVLYVYVKTELVRKSHAATAPVSALASYGPLRLCGTTSFVELELVVASV